MLIAFCPVTKKKPNQKYSVNWTHVVLCDPWKKYRQQVLGLTLHLHLLLGSSSNKSRQESNSCWRTELCTAVNSALRKNANKRMFKDCAMRSLERYWSIVIALATITALNSHHVLDQSELKLSSSHVTLRAWNEVSTQLAATAYLKRWESLAASVHASFSPTNAKQIYVHGSQSQSLLGSIPLNVIKQRIYHK